MGAAGLLLRAQLRQHGRSWLALAVLAALAGGLVMAAAATARATAAAFPAFVIRHGYDDIVYTLRPLPQLARIPQVARVTPVQAPFVVAVSCALCGAINRQSPDVFGIAPRDLGRTVQLAPLILLAAVLLVTVLLAVPPALLAARACPADLLRTE